MRQLIYSYDIFFVTSFIILNLSSCQPHSLHYYSTNVFFIQVTYHRKNRRNYVTSSFAIIQIWIIPSKSGNLFWRNYNHNANVYVVFMRFWFFNILQTTCNNLTTKEKNLDWFDFFFQFFLHNFENKYKYKGLYLWEFCIQVKYDVTRK